MIRDDVRKRFREIVEPQVNSKVDRFLSDLLVASAQKGPRPDAPTPKTVKFLWKS